MRILIAEDELISRLVLQGILEGFGSINTVVNGEEAVIAAGMALEQGRPYDLICLDVMMPRLDGLEALCRIRALEVKRGITSSRGAKVVMISALDDPKKIVTAFKGLCDAYIIKPVDKAELLKKLKEIGCS
ncbi:MAG: response regulator [Desulfuromonadaceae bacterium]|nr:response regulator [Desulfuromonas sp.]MDY0185916.1 response regulator [Desulfuromonadaceae bacterium]